jgi:hypothetical protein
MRFTEEVSARMPAPEEARLLGLRTGLPVIDPLDVARALDGRAVEVCATAMASKRFILAYELPTTCGKANHDCDNSGPGSGKLVYVFRDSHHGRVA